MIQIQVHRFEDPDQDPDSMTLLIRILNPDPGSEFREIKLSKTAHFSNCYQFYSKKGLWWIRICIGSTTDLFCYKIGKNLHCIGSGFNNMVDPDPDYAQILDPDLIT
jgi:hypothetical protein